jgi:hypothetical protein
MDGLETSHRKEIAIRPKFAASQEDTIAILLFSRKKPVEFLGEVFLGWIYICL